MLAGLPFEIWGLGFIWSLEFGCRSFLNGVPSRTLTSNLEFRKQRSFHQIGQEFNPSAKPAFYVFIP